MISVDELVAIFADKLQRTGSMDAALLKTVWNAYKRGYADGVAAEQQDREKTE